MIIYATNLIEDIDPAIISRTDPFYRIEFKSPNLKQLILIAGRYINTELAKRGLEKLQEKDIIEITTYLNDWTGREIQSFSRSAVKNLVMKEKKENIKEFLIKEIKKANKNKTVLKNLVEKSVKVEI